MAYTKNTWTDGDIVTSEKLNHMENGIASGENVFIVGGATYGGGAMEGTLDKTWQEIRDAMQSKICILIIADDNAIAHELITAAYIGPDGKYGVTTANTSEFTTSTANGYPSAADDEGK